MIEMKVEGIDPQLKDLLEEYSFWEDRIKDQERKIELLKDRQTSITVNNDGLPKGTARQTLADYMVRLEELENDLKELQHLQGLVYDKIFSILSRLDNPEWIDIIWQHYIDQKSLKEIRLAKGRSRAWIADHHKQALKAMEKVLYNT